MLVFMILISVLTVIACAKTNDKTIETTEVVVTEAPTTETSAEKIDINVAALIGPTGMGMVELMEKNEAGETANRYNFELASTPDALVGKVISGELDIIAVPTNLALVLYNRTEGNIKLAAVNTLGVLYVLENGDEIQSVADLSGKTIHVSGKGAVPDFVAQTLIKDAGLVVDQTVTMDYALEHADLATAMVSGDVKIGMLPQPHVTAALMRNPDLRVALDVTAEWRRVSGGSEELMMGAIIVQKAFAEAHPAALNAFLDEYKASVAFVNQNVADAAGLIEKYGILPNAAIAEKAIPLSNIVYIDAMEAKPSLEAFFKILFDLEPKSVGGKLADEGFYYNR
ncbi:MAG TPA: hypothetical protein DCS67_11245 [Clostridiales bacterium UBA8960]|nr:hypothetical protein [Clostridiales bacterium UBA8960]